MIQFFTQISLDYRKPVTLDLQVLSYELAKFDTASLAISVVEKLVLQQLYCAQSRSWILH